MKKRIFLVLLTLVVLITAIPANAAVTSEAVTANDFTVVRGYSGDDGSVSYSGKNIVLNGNGVASAKQVIAIDGSKLSSGESGVVFTITYNENYTSLTADSQNYRFAVALMDERTFQGADSGNGLGMELRLNNAAGNIQGRGLYFKGSLDRNIKYPERNNGSAFGTAESGKSVMAKINYSGAKWHIYFDSNNDNQIDRELATFDPASSWEINNGSAPYFPKDLINSDHMYLVFGSYNGNDMNVSLSINQVYGAFSLKDEPINDIGAVRYGENVALEENLLTRFYVSCSDALLANDATVELKLNQSNGSAYTTVTKIYDSLTDGSVYDAESNTYYYTIPVPAARVNDAITITITDKVTGESTHWSTSIASYCDGLIAKTTGTDEESVLLVNLLKQVKSYGNAASAYFEFKN